jgi:hypothetical protein
MNTETSHPDTANGLPASLLPLAAEVATYRRELPRLLEEGEGGRFAVIKGDQVLATWDSYRDALQYGYERFGDHPFMAQRIDARDVDRLAQIFPASGNGIPCPS